MGLLVAAFLVRLFYVFRFRVDSDEPQHLHVIWGWAHGLLQYRDVFDNHTPLFHMVLWPLVRWLGDRPDLLLLMRLTMFPLFGVIIVCVYLTARHLFSERAGWWAAAGAATFPLFYEVGMEFRPDNLWAMLWVLAIALLVLGRATTLRAALIGLIAGAAVGVSSKSILLIGCLGAAWVLSVTLCDGVGTWRHTIRRHAVSLGAAFLGFLVVPGALIAWFYAEGALAPFYYCTVTHNLVAGTISHSYPLRVAAFVVAVSVVLWLIRLNMRRAPPGPLTVRRVFLLLFVTLYISSLVFRVWPVLEAENWPPILPLLVICMVQFLLEASAKWAGVLRVRDQTRLAALFRNLVPLLAVVQLSLLIVYAPWQNRTQGHVEMWKAVLRLTRPGDYVMDAKGGLIFRQRCFRYVLERMTIARIERHLIQDDIAARLVEMRCCVIGPDIERLPQGASEFIEKNYLSVGPLFVAGTLLHPSSTDPQQPIFFDVHIPMCYSIVAPHGPATGQLDGSPYDGPRFLDAGRHEFRPRPAAGALALVWARAIECGYQPADFVGTGKSVGTQSGETAPVDAGATGAGRAP